MRGLAIFTIAADLPRMLPRVLQFEAPVVTVAAAPAYVIDFPTEELPRLLRLLQDPSLGQIRAGTPQRSPLSTEVEPRGKMLWMFPVTSTELELALFWRHLRRTELHGRVFFGSSLLYSEPSALIVELTGAAAALQAWTLCSGILALSSEKLLVSTDAEPEAWQPMLDSLMKQDPKSAIVRIKWRPSRHGGRPWATPEATQVQLAALRRTKGGRLGQAAPMCNVADVQSRGPTGYEDLEVYWQLMEHFQTTAGVALAEAASPMVAKPGTWLWLAAADPTAPQGRLRLFLRTHEEVQSLFQALHGRTVQVGSDLVGIQVLHDISDAVGETRQGNGVRGRAGRRPPPAQQ